MERLKSESLANANHLVERSHTLVRLATERLAHITNHGAEIDNHQRECEQLAQWAAFSYAANSLLDYAKSLDPGSEWAGIYQDFALYFASQAFYKVSSEMSVCADFSQSDETPFNILAKNRSLLMHGLNSELVRSIGQRVIEMRGVNNSPLDGELGNLRFSAREFTDREITPNSQEIHRQDLLVPEELIQKMVAHGFFGSSIPEQYEGADMGYPAMVILTEELSAGSLVAGSLITRPEILSRALLNGGTEQQRQLWLPKIAKGKVMVAVSVTEPDVGSDVAAVECKATRGESDGKKGWFLKGQKAWSTFAGRADVLALLARTGDVSSGTHGLSLFIVEKDPFDGHSFAQTQAGGGSIAGTANPTPGYRGLHSFTLSFDDYFVPEENLVGGESGLNKGFYFQMQGFAAGRLQTAARAVGVGQASLEKACNYSVDRKQFGRSISEYQLTQHKIGDMAAKIAVARQLTMVAARAMQNGNSTASIDAAMAKLFASDVAVSVSQEAQLIHGGWGYSEEDPISRYVADALVLPIFEGVKPILELKVIARELLKK